MRIIKRLNQAEAIDVSLETLDEAVAYIAERPEKRTLFLSDGNYSKELVSAIKAHPDRKCILDMDVMSEAYDGAGFEEFYWLTGLGFGYPKSKFDFSKMQSLSSFGGVWSAKWIGVEQCKSLKRTQLSSCGWDMDNFPCLEQFESIALIQPKLKSLSGINRASSLKFLELCRAKNLEDISAISACHSTLIELDVSSCKKIASYQAVHQLTGLERLLIAESAPIDSIGFIQSMPNLKTLSVFETTVLDNDLSPCLHLPQLIDFRSERKRAYHPSVDAIKELVAKRKAGEPIDIEPLLKQVKVEAKNVNRRDAQALAAIKAAYGTEDGEDGVDAFVEHHVDELPTSYWQEQLGAAKPSPQQVLGLLVLREAWDDDCVYDFTLPGEVTDYVISVRFDEAGEVEEISMES